MTDQTTQLLKASIAFERNKTFKLTNHSCEALSMIIGLINEKKDELDNQISGLEYMISSAEDMSETFENDLRRKVGAKKNELEKFMSWQSIFLNAWTEVKGKK